MKKIKNILFVFFCMFILTGCSMSEENTDQNLISEKTVTELNYIEDSVLKITNKYAKGEYIKDEEVDWEAILEDEKKINEVLETIILDLAEVNIKKEDVVLLSSEVNNLLTSTIAENESELLLRLQTLYSLVPKYLNQFSDDKNGAKEKELKSIVLLAYAQSNNDMWEESKVTIQSAVDKYNEMMNDVDYMQSNSYKLNRVYILLGEVKNAIDSENLEMVELKFVNFIEKI